MRLLCGWCHQPTPPGMCEHCKHDSETPWRQRGREAPVVGGNLAPGRPALDPPQIRRLYDTAHAALEAKGQSPTVEAIAEFLDRNPRTIRDWRKRFDLR